MNKRLVGALLAALCLVSSTSMYAQESNSAQDMTTMNMAENLDLEEDRISSKTLKEFQTILKIGSKEALVGTKKLQMPAEPVIRNDRSYLPLRFVTETILNATVEWQHTKKKAVVKKDGKIVEVTLNSNIAVVDGNEVILDAPPIMLNDSILLPLRFMSEAFDMKVHYKSQDKTITITSMRENESPIADFSFSQEVYVAGQNIKITDNSFDTDGDSIYETIWTVNGKEYGNLKEVEALLNKLKPGSYEVTLMVEDYYGAWSNKAYKTVVIEPNKAPSITTFKPAKESYAQGEPINFEYLYDNEAWEDIKNARWTYRYINEPSYSAVITKPTAFFAKGEYIVTLQLTDTYGNVSAVKETTVKVTDEVKEAELSYKFTKGQIGDTIDNIAGVNYRNYKDALVTQYKMNEDKLVVSDSPEEVDHEGILYTTPFEGKGRLLLHHINGFDKGIDVNKMLVVVAENTTDSPITVTLNNKVIKGPNGDVMFLGQQLLKDYFNGVPSETITIAPGDKRYLYTSQNRSWAHGQCISGLMDISTTGPIQLTTAVMDKKYSIYSLPDLEPLDKSIHIRGTFEGTIIDYAITADASEPSKLVLGQQEDEWVSGVDEITGELAKNKGNYGVSYKIKITAKEDTGIILNPRADIFRGAIKWEGKETHLAPSYGYFLKTNKKAVMLGVIKAGETKTLEYMLPNGSSAPVVIGFIPRSKW